jgi:protein-S-isoprenylcysteine O-methyltransferase Ste14
MADLMAKVVSAHSLQRSWTYRNRSRVTGLVVLTAWAYVALTRPWIPQGSALDWIVDAAAWLAFLGGAGLRLWATLWIAGRKKNKLVDDGPYRACRNPLYLGTFAMGIGLALFLKSLVFMGALGLLILLYVWYVVPAEERYMPIQCADDYRGYCARVPRWIPRLSQLRRDEVFRRPDDPTALHRECLRMAGWLLLPVLAQLTCHLRGTAWSVW